MVTKKDKTGIAKEQTAKKAAPKNKEALKADKAAKTAKAPNADFPKLALIRIRGMIHVKKDIIRTLFNLRLRKNNACVVIENTPANRAAAAKCKDYIAYGEITQDTYNELVDKRGKKDESGALKKFFLLHPPLGGFEKKGIKVPFSRGGALGYRAENMNELVKKML